MRIDKYIFSTALIFQLATFAGFACLQIGQKLIATLTVLPSIELIHLLILTLQMLPDALNDIMPISMVLAILLTNNQLRNQNEFAALMATGATPFRVYRPLIALAVLTGLALFINLAALKPLAERQNAELQHTIANTHFTKNLAPGEIREIPSVGIQMMAEQNDNGVLHDVFIALNEKQQYIVSKRAQITDSTSADYRLNLFDGSILTINSDGSYSISHFKEASQLLFRDLYQPRNSVDFKPIWQLTNNNSPYERTELQWRISIILYCLAAALIALLFKPNSPRSSTTSAILLGIVMYFVFNQIVYQAARAGEKGLVNPDYLFYWLYPSLVLASTAAAFLLRVFKRA